MLTPEEIAAEVCGFSQTGEIVTLKMTRDDYMSLMLRLGMASRLMRRQGRPPGLDLVDRLNRNNPNYRPYGPLAEDGELR